MRRVQARDGYDPGIRVGKFNKSVRPKMLSLQINGYFLQSQAAIKFGLANATTIRAKNDEFAFLLEVFAFSMF